MKKIAAWVIWVIWVISILAVIAVVKSGVEFDNRADFDASFLFMSSGTYYVLWTGDPNPALKDHEEKLIKKALAWRYDDLRRTHRKMTSASAEQYGELRKEFLYTRKILKEEVEIARYFGYTVWINEDDYDGLLKEEK